MTPGFSNSAFEKTIQRLEDGLTAALIANPPEVRGGDERASDVRAVMDQKSFSQVLISFSKGTRMMSIVSRADLDSAQPRDAIHAFARPIEQDAMISHDTSIRTLLPMFSRRDYFLTLRHDRIDGIVELSDIDKPPTRLFLFAHTTELEARMAHLIERHHPDDEWLEYLSEARQQKTQEQFDRKQARDFQTSRMNCTQLCDKRDVILKSPELRRYLGEGSISNWNSRFNAIQRLRDNIAHSESILENRADVSALLETVRAMDDLIERFGAREAQMT